MRGAGGLERAAHRPRRARRPGATLSRSGSSKRMKSWKTAVTRARHASRSKLAQVDAVDLDRARAAGRRGGTAAWRASSCRRRSGRRWRATMPAGIVRSKPSSTGSRRPDSANVTSRKRISLRGHAGRADADPDASAPARRHRRLEPQHGGDRRRRAVERPVQPAERDHRRADGALA